MRLKIVIGVTTYCMWGALAFFVKDMSPQLHEFMQFNIVIATGLIGLALRDLQSPQPPKETP